MIKVTDLTKYYGDVQALKGINFSVKPGEIVGLLGPNGAGKTTLLRLIGGLIAPSSGEIVFTAGGESDSQSDHAPRGQSALAAAQANAISFCFQEGRLLPWRNVLDNVLVQIDLRGGDTAAYGDRARTLLAKVGLAGFENRMPRELSGGMRQRAAIVRALIHEPPLLMMDEPFGALDALTREQMRIDLEKLWLDRGQTTFFITHGISEAVALADRVVVMTPRPGRIERIIEIDLPRPRHKAVISSQRFTEYCNEITECFMRHGVIQY